MGEKSSDEPFLELSQVEHKHGTVRCTRADFVALRVPADLKDAARATITMHQLARLRTPDVNTFVKAARSKIFAVWTKCDRIHRLSVLCERVNRRARLNIP